MTSADISYGGPSSKMDDHPTTSCVEIRAPRVIRAASDARACDRLIWGSICVGAIAIAAIVAVYYLGHISGYRDGYREAVEYYREQVTRDLIR